MNAELNIAVTKSCCKKNKIHVLACSEGLIMLSLLLLSMFCSEKGLRNEMTGNIAECFLFLLITTY